MKHSGTYAYRFFYLLVMALFGCLGPIVRAIGLPSPVTACLRAVLSFAALSVYISVSHVRKEISTVKPILIPMIACGAALALDWIGLFEAYNYTTVATATVCYYITPVLVCVLSAFFMKERFTMRHTVCVGVSFLGMILVSGITESGNAGGDAKGVIYALLGAAGYTSVIMINRRFKGGSQIVRTNIQLAAASAVMIPYVLLRYDIGALTLTAKGIALLFVLSVGLTAVTYVVYFSLISKIPARTVAVYSYADPVAAVMISVFFLNERLTVPAGLGALMIIAAAAVSELKET